MASDITEEVDTFNDSFNDTFNDSVLLDGVEEITPDAQPKRKGRQRLLRGLQRMSSSPSLAQFGRARSSSSPYHGPSSFSCVSLASSSSPFGQPSTGSYFSQMSNGTAYSTNTSIPGTPRPDSPYFDGIEKVLAVRKVDNVVNAGLSTTTIAIPAVRPKKPPFNIWAHLPHEMKIYVLSFLQPKELVRASRVNKEFYKICFDGQLWTCFDASEFYQDIPAESLAKIIVAAGPFVKDLNLRGCVQVEHYKRAEVVAKACRNLINATLEGCRNLQRTTLHSLLKSNVKLAHLNLTGLTAVTNVTCKIIAQSCPSLELFNVSWCKHMDARGIKLVIEGCKQLKDLRAGEIRGFDSTEVAQVIFRTNRLERLVLTRCEDLDDNALSTMIHGTDPEMDILTDLPIVPPRKLRHLDLSRCSGLTTRGVKTLGHFVPDLEGLQLSGITSLTDEALEPILATCPRLTHLELEDLAELTNSLLSEHLAKSPCVRHLEYLSLGYCENLGDAGMLPVLRNCTSLRSVDLDNTRISDLSLAEAASMVRQRAGRTTDRSASQIKSPPARRFDSDSDSSPATPSSPSFPTEIIALKCFYGWQMTVDEHTKRVLKGDLAAAARLERKWADYMQASEEAGAGGAGIRRRRRRAREAQMAHADEEEGGAGAGAGGGRRRARTLACMVM
ncbi:F-box/LRR-repeat protein [Pleurostoma richardsiae]|uniref:F-box/LRR-repeat protein n=1 Tax=Pleurostoma richardsiae TaxID=41990 RepID=A0AA38RHS0_9PEZI|nr:F-box/LRR-repeat protein [Pleurostoma richardsiae]